MKRSLLAFGLAILALDCVNPIVSPLQAADPPWPPTVLVVAADPAAAEEASDPATFLVVRTGPANTALTVPYTLGGTAENGVDYQPLTDTVTIPEGAWFAPVTVTPIDDFLVEDAESAVLALQQPPQWPPPYIVTWPSVAFAEIADNDAAPTNRPPLVNLVSPPHRAIFEAHEDIPLVARASDPNGRVVSVEFFANDLSLGVVSNHPVIATPEMLTAAAVDPAFNLDAALFPDPAAPAGTVHPLPHNLFRLVWSSAPPGEYVLTAVATDNDGASARSEPVTITVIEVPPRVVVTIRATDPVATEPNPATDYLDTATFQVHRTGPTNFPLHVACWIGGTALNGTDYQELQRSLMIPAGERTMDVVIEPLDDLLVEGPESVVLTIVPPNCPMPDCYSVGPADTAKAVIRDNDVPPNQPPVVRLIKPENGEVFLAPANIRFAALARDLDGYVTTIEFFEGTNSLGMVTNAPLTSNARPPFSIVWSNVPPGHYVLTAVATDNGGAQTQSCPVEIQVVPQVLPPVVNIEAIDAEAAETPAGGAPNPAVFAVTRTSPADSPLLVFYSIGGTAENGLDYRSLSGRVLIAAGSVSSNIVVAPIEDNLVEGLETVVLKLELPPILDPTATAPRDWYRIGSNNVAAAVIRDNDSAPTNYPPRVALVRPGEGEAFIAPAEIRLAAATHDCDGFVRTVEFFADEVSLGIVSNSLSATGANPTSLSPEQLFQMVWEDAPLGGHVLTAKATDNRGATAVSGPVHIRVLPPSIAVVTIVATDPYACEGNLITPYPVNSTGPTDRNLNPRTATFTVTRTGPTHDSLTVFYRLEGSAQNAVDYRELSGQIHIPAGAPSAQIIVNPIDDLLPEPTEPVVATLEPMACPAIYPPPPGCYIVGDPHTATAYILDNDYNLSPKLEIVQPRDGSVFPSGADIEIGVVAADPDGWVSTVEFYNGTNLLGQQTVHFFMPPPPGQVQKFSMVWSNAPAGEHVLTAKAFDDGGAVSASDPVHIKVAALPPVPVVTIHALDPVAVEPNPLLTVLPDTATFNVVRTGPLSDPLTVHYRISGTASDGVDYQKLTGEVTIPPNSAVAEIEIIPLADDLVEGTESVIMTLAQPPCATTDAGARGCYLVSRPAGAIAYILDRNTPPSRPPTVAIVSPPNNSVFQAPVDVRLVAAADDPDGWVTTVEFFDGTNSLGVVSNAAWVLDTAPVRLPNIGLEVLPDHSPLRPFSLCWQNVPAGRHELTAVATDNTGQSTRSRPVEISVLPHGDTPIVGIMALDAVAREGGTNTAILRVRRVGPTNLPLTVYYTVRGSASNGTDYASLPGSITIPEGRRGARIVVQPIDDNLPERIETVILRLAPSPSEPADYLVGRPDRTGAVILDHDCPMIASRPLPDGSLHLRLPLPIGMPFRLEASPDLWNWEPVVCDVATDTGVSFVQDGQAREPQRFFRVVQEFGDVDLEE